MAVAQAITTPTDRAGAAAASNHLASVIQIVGLDQLARFAQDAQARAGVASGSETAPKMTLAVGQVAPSGSNIERVGLRCDGIKSGCQNGGSFGTTGMYQVGRKIICQQCALKELTLPGDPADVKREIIDRFLLD